MTQVDERVMMLFKGRAQESPKFSLDQTSQSFL